MLQRYAVTLASLTFLLIVWGGVVHNTRSSLACPDWPLCFGQVMPEMKDGVLIEHSHRMLGTVVGAMTVILAIGLGRRKEGLGRLGLVAIGAVCLQGLLGGLTVIYRLPTWVSTSHLGLSMLFFGLLLFFIVRLGARRVALSERAQRASAIGAAVVYTQIVLGAFMRHAGAGLACLDWPLCRGTLFPADGNAYLDLHMVHRLLGVVVLGVVIWVIARVWPETSGRLSLRVLLGLLPVLVAVQIALGIWSITTFLAVEPVTLHLAVAALIFATLVVLTFVARGIGAMDAASQKVASL
jgi:heme A synthase